MAETFTAPDFVLDADAEAIQARMMENLPPDIDDMPGGIPWDFTMPTALAISEFTQSRLVRALKVMFPQYAWGDWLDMHGAKVNVIRRAARKATGTLHITGQIGTEIPAGTVFCTPSVDGSENILYTTDTDTLITTGVAYIPITAVVAGRTGNVMAGAVSLAFRPISGITSISNDNAITDGTDEEDDETYRQRILEVYRGFGGYTGCPADYVRWAMEVAGVGHAVCIPEWDGPGTVKLVIMDTSGAAASESLLASVQLHIMGEDESSLERLAPIGAVLTTVAPEPLTITYDFKVDLESGYTLQEVKDAVKISLDALYTEAIENGVLHYADCFAAINNTEGVYDCKDVEMNSGTANITILQSDYPVTVIGTVTEY